MKLKQNILGLLHPQGKSQILPYAQLTFFPKIACVLIFLLSLDTGSLDRAEKQQINAC